MKRMLFIVGITVIGLVMTFHNVYYGLLLYTFYSFASPLELTYGMLEGSKLSFIIAAIVIGLTIFRKRKVCVSHPLTLLCLLFLVICFFSLASRGNYTIGFALSSLEIMISMIFMALLAVVLIEDFNKLKLYIIVIAFSSGSVAFYYGVFGLLSGSSFISGPGRFGDNNAYAVWLNTLLPLVYFSSKLLTKHSFKLVAKAIFFGNIVAIVLTFSRAGTLTMLMTLLLIALHMRNKILVFFMAALAVCLVAVLMPSDGGNQQFVIKNKSEMSVVEATLNSFKERLETLKKPKEEIGSAVGRIHFWKTAIIMANANPLLGVGFRRYHNAYNEYDNSFGRHGYGRAVHNTTLSVLAELGYSGFLLYVLMVFNILNITRIAKHRIRRMGDMVYRDDVLVIVDMLRLALVAYLFNGFFVACINHETFWALITIAIALDLRTREMKSDESEKFIKTIS